MGTIGEIMTTNPSVCLPSCGLTELARVMRDHDCGFVPVVDPDGSGRVIGVVTDRDIVLRVVAEGRNPLELAARDAWSTQVYTLPATASVDECRQLMESRLIRRVPIVDNGGRLIGVVSLSDLAREVDDAAVGEALEEISQPDTRQLYGEVLEHTQMGTAVKQVDGAGEFVEVNDRRAA